MKSLDEIRDEKARDYRKLSAHVCGVSFDHPVSVFAETDFAKGFGVAVFILKEENQALRETLEFANLMTFNPGVITHDELIGACAEAQVKIREVLAKYRGSNE